MCVGGGVECLSVLLFSSCLILINTFLICVFLLFKLHLLWLSFFSYCPSNWTCQLLVWFLVFIFSFFCSCLIRTHISKISFYTFQYFSCLYLSSSCIPTSFCPLDSRYSILFIFYYKLIMDIMSPELCFPLLCLYRFNIFENTGHNHIPALLFSILCCLS